MQQDKHFKIGLVIGRFQPFHNGHIFLFKEALKFCDKIIIGIGSSNVLDENNPWTPVQRKQMLEKVLKIEKLENKVLKIIEIPDIPDDEEWFKTTVEKAGEFDVSVGKGSPFYGHTTTANDSVNGIFKSHGIEVLEIPLWERYLYEGWKIRKLIRKGENWENRVPHYLVANIKEFKI